MLLKLSLTWSTRIFMTSDSYGWRTYRLINCLQKSQSTMLMVPVRWHCDKASRQKLTYRKRIADIDMWLHWRMVISVYIVNSIRYMSNFTWTCHIRSKPVQCKSICSLQTHIGYLTDPPDSLTKLVQSGLPDPLTCTHRMWGSSRTRSLVDHPTSKM